MKSKILFLICSAILILTSPAYSENSKYLPPVPLELINPKNLEIKDKKEQSSIQASGDQITKTDTIISPTPIPQKIKEIKIQIPAKKVSGGILVREDVFNDLVKAKKTIILLKEENEHYKEKASYFQSKYEELYQKAFELNEIQKERLKLKDDIIEAKNEKNNLLEYQIGNYKDLNKKTEQELRAAKSKNFLINLLSTGALIYGASKTDDNGAKAAMIGAALIQTKW